MKSLKTILNEGLLDDIDNTLSTGNAIVKKEFLARLRAKIENAQSGWYVKLDNDTYNDIIQFYEEIPSEQKKGTRWTVIVPNEESNFEPITVAPHKGIYRKFNEKTCKEVLGTTLSAWEKRLKKLDNLYKKYKLSNGWLAEPLYSGFQLVLYFMFSSFSGYKLVKSVPSGKDWYTIGLLADWKTKKYDYVSYNPNTKEWAYGMNSNIPSIFKANPEGARSVSRHFLCSLADPKYVWTFDQEYINKVLKKTNVEDYKSNKYDFYGVTLGKWNLSRDTYNKSKIYINGKNFTYITQEQLDLDDIKSTEKTKTVKIKRSDVDVIAELNAIKDSGDTKSLHHISDTTADYVYNVYTEVKPIPANINGKTWFKVCREGNDVKYGSYYICIDTMERRNSTFDEFYDGGIVD
jgi:hypothetical protein